MFLASATSITFCLDMLSFHALLYRVYICECVDTCVCVFKSGVQGRILEVSLYHLLPNYLKAGCLTELSHFDKSAWPTSSWDPPSLSWMLGLQTQAIMSSFLHGYLGFEHRIHACRANPLTYWNISSVPSRFLKCPLLKVQCRFSELALSHDGCHLLLCSLSLGVGDSPNYPVTLECTLVPIVRFPISLFL